MGPALAGYDAKSSGLIDFKNWRNWPINTSGGGSSSSSSELSAASRIPSESISSSETNSGLPVRTATATASDGRLETTVTSPPRRSRSSA